MWALLARLATMAAELANGLSDIATIAKALKGLSQEWPDRTWTGDWSQNNFAVNLDGEDIDTDNDDLTLSPDSESLEDQGGENAFDAPEEDREQLPEESDLESDNKGEEDEEDVEEDEDEETDEDEENEQELENEEDQELDQPELLENDESDNAENEDDSDEDLNYVEDQLEVDNQLDEEIDGGYNLVGGIGQTNLPEGDFEDDFESLYARLFVEDSGETEDIDSEYADAEISPESVFGGDSNDEADFLDFVTESANLLQFDAGMLIGDGELFQLDKETLLIDITGEAAQDERIE